MEDEIEDLVGDVKLTDSQKSVATTNVYSLDFTDSSSDKNNSSGKDTYVLECDDSEDSETYSLHENKSSINLNRKCPIQEHADRDSNLQRGDTNKINREASTSFHKCSIVAQEIFTQTSKTIIELAETDGVFRKSENNSLETQTSFISMTENRAVEYRIVLSGSHQKFSKNKIVHKSDQERDIDKFYITRDEVDSNSLDDEFSKFLVSEIENDMRDTNTSRSSNSNVKILLITDEESREDILNDEQNGNSSDYESSKHYSDVEEDSLIEQHERQFENIECRSDASDVAKSVDNEVEELYKKLTESIDLNSLQRSCEPEINRFGILTPLSEESTVKKENLLDNPKIIKLIVESNADTLFTNNAGIQVKVLSDNNKKEKDTFKLPPLQTNKSCPNSPHLNFLFSMPRPLSNTGTLPSLLKEQKSRWEIGTKDLASGESALINGRNGLVWNTSESVHLPPIHVEGYVLNTTETNSYPENLTKLHTIKSEQEHRPISIKEKINELKMCSKNTNANCVGYRKNTDTTYSRSVSPGSATTAESRLYDAAERGCEALCAELLKRLRSQSWFEVTDTLEEIPRALEKLWGVIAENRIADLIRQVIGHIESPRTLVTRTACYTLASILKNTNYTKKPEFYEAMTILLVKTGSFSRPVRRAANVSLDNVVCSVELSHAVTALCIHGVTHKSALVRCAATRLLVVCCALAEGGRELLRARPPSAACARKHALRSLATLLEDKSIDTRKYAERLYFMLRPLTNFEAYYLNDVDVELASKQMKKYDQMLIS